MNKYYNMISTAPEILYEDNHIISVIKPAGILSQSDGSDKTHAGESDMLSILSEYLRIKYHKPGKAFVGLVHRLDRNVGGTMVFAKTSKGASRLSEEMRNGRFRKGYFALAENTITKKTGVLKNYLYKDEKRNIVTDDRKKGKESILVYDTVEKFDGYSLVFALPVTGRTHQIRAQMAFAGNPLADDVKYGGSRVTKGEISYPALWSAVISVKHPVRDEYMLLQSVPDYINSWQAAGRNISRICQEYLKGLGKDGIDRLYGFWN